MTAELMVFVTLVLGLPLALTFVWSARDRRHERATRRVAREQAEAGLDVPVSLHPIIDPDRCIGSGACIASCPEKHVLGMLDGQASLIGGAHCIGHGRCAAECPVKAIRLVFGTSQRGVDLPVVSPHFESDVPGLYIAGELGGMGLIRNAVTQGVEAVDHVAAQPDARGAIPGALDLAIVGAGPAGLGGALAARRHGLSCVVIEREPAGVGGSVLHYPRHKVVMTAPVDLPGHGRIDARTLRKEELVALLDDVVERAGLDVRGGVTVDAVTRDDGGGFTVRTAGGGTLRARRVLLAIGRRGVPRKLGVPGEEGPNVVYRLVDARQYRGRAVVVVGGGDSALEAALSIAAEPDTRVLLSYRGDSFRRARAANRDALAPAVAAGRLRVELTSDVVRIGLDRVVLKTARGEEDFAAAGGVYVIVQAGGVLPDAFLAACGVRIETHHGD